MRSFPVNVSLLLHLIVLVFDPVLLGEGCEEMFKHLVNYVYESA